MKIAFLCLAHDNFEYLTALAKYCISDNDDFYLHIDRRVTHEYNLPDEVNTLPRYSSYETYWGSFNIVLATQALLQYSSYKMYDFYILISGSDIPLLSKKRLKSTLKIHGSKVSIWGSSLDINNKNLKNQFYKYNFLSCSYSNPREAYLSGNLPRRFISKIISSILALFNTNDKHEEFFFGSQWWVINAEIAKYLIEDVDFKKESQKYSTMFAPDEKYFNTMIRKKYYKLCEDNDRFGVTHGYSYIDWTRGSIKKINIENLKKQPHILFARKVCIEDNNKNIKHIYNLID